MRILITNDDGLNTNGMLHLEHELAALGEVWAIAPDRERSATSMALSIHDSLRLVKMGERRYMLTGFPADCVNVCLFSPGFPPMDLVVSGINHGANLGDDVHYSGTVGAARHAALHGLPAVALSSLVREHDGDFRRFARWVRLWISENFSELTRGLVYNINYPLESGVAQDDPLPGHSFARQGRRVYRDGYRVSEEGVDYSILHLKDTGMGHLDESGSDFEVIERGEISITPLGTRQTADEELKRWQMKQAKLNLKKR